MRREFVEPISSEYCWLQIEPLGVLHPRCGELADVAIELDAFFCRHCGFRGRIAGSWVLEHLERDRPSA